MDRFLISTSLFWLVESVISTKKWSSKNYTYLIQNAEDLLKNAGRGEIAGRVGKPQTARKNASPNTNAPRFSPPDMFFVDKSLATLIFLADAYGCKIVLDADTALAKPQYNSQRQNIYSCTPDSSSPQYEVHVLSVYEVINKRPPTAGDATVNIISQGRSNRPIVLVLGSYEPVNWILNLPANITISKVILVGTKQKPF